jgi:hypothetical protein
MKILPTMSVGKNIAVAGYASFAKIKNYLDDLMACVRS